MSHIVLALKYRSQNFTDLIGQDVLVKTLTNAITKEKIAHGYIFTGIRGTGKTSSARIFAKALNCLGADGENKKPTATPCGVCENCVAITESRHMDVIELDAASHTGVDNMRSILEESAYRPMSARYKIFIIDEVHMLSNSAFNAMLKTLEEPPEHVIFILATTELQKVPITILSRCQKFSLARISPEELSKLYQSICDKEKITIEKQALHLISHSADGSARDGLSLLDQAISLSENNNISSNLVSQMLGKTNFNTVVSIFDSMIKNDVPSILKSTNEFIMQGGSAKALLNDLLDFIYSITQAKASSKSVENLTTNVVEQDILTERSKDFNYPLLARLWQLVLKGLEDLKNVPNQHSVLDMVCLRIAYLSQDVLPKKSDIPDGSETKKVSKGLGKPENSLEENKKELEKIPEKKSVENIKDLCKLLSENKEVLLRSVLEKEAKIEHFEKGKICLCLSNDGKKFTTQLIQFLKEKTGDSWIVELIENSKENTLAEKDLESVKNDDLVSETMNLFPGAKIENITDD